MAIVIFSISNSFENFHRKPVIEKLKDKIIVDGQRIIFFNRPRWIFHLIRNFFSNDKFENGEINDVYVCSLYTILPPSLFYSLPLLRYLFVTLPIKLQLKYRLKKLNVKADYLFFYKPDQWLYIKDLGVKYIFTQYDNYLHDHSYHFSKRSDYKKVLFKCIEGSFRTFYTSPSFKTDAKNSRYFPNAVADSMIASDEEQNKVDSNIIGFVGNIDSSIDENIIEAICKSYPNYKVQLIGPIRNDKINELGSKYSNLELVGRVPYEDLNHYLKRFKVGICPYRFNEFNLYRNPLKLYEYCAQGVPAVSSICDFDPEGKKLVSMASSNKEFVERIKCAIDDDSIINKRAMIDFAKKNTWKIRIDFLCKELSL